MDGDDTLGPDATGGDDDYTYDLLVSDDASMTYAGSGDSSISGYDSGGWTDDHASGWSSLSDHDEGSLSQDLSGDLHGSDDFTVLDGSSESDAASWSDHDDDANSPSYSGDTSYSMDYHGGDGLSLAGDDTTVGTAPYGPTVQPSYEFSQGDAYQDAYADTGDDQGEFNQSYGDQYGGEGSGSGSNQVEGTYWSDSDGPNYSVASEYDSAGQASWTDQGYSGSDWAYSGWATDWTSDSGGGWDEDIDGTYSSSFSDDPTGSATGQYSDEYSGYWTTWEGWFGAIGYGYWDDWIWGMDGYYGTGAGIPGVPGQVEGLLSTAEGRISSALDVGALGYGVDDLLLVQGGAGFSFEIGAGGFYNPTAPGWEEAWAPPPGEVGYRRTADGSTGNGDDDRGGNLLTPGVIVAPNSLNAQIDDDGSDIMGDDPDDSNSAPPRLDQGGGPGAPGAAGGQAQQAGGQVPPEEENIFVQHPIPGHVGGSLNVPKFRGRDTRPPTKKDLDEYYSKHPKMLAPLEAPHGTERPIHSPSSQNKEIVPEKAVRGYPGATRGGYSPPNLGDRDQVVEAMKNLMNNMQFQLALREALSMSGRNAATAHEHGVYIYYNVYTGDLWFRHRPGPPLLFGAPRPMNSFIDPGNPAPSYPGGWVYLGFGHTHPFPPEGPPSLGPPGMQDVMIGQPVARPITPWYIIQTGGQIYGVWRGTIIMPDGKLLYPGQYHFATPPPNGNGNGGLIPGN